MPLNSHDNFKYNKDLQPLAVKLRKNMTKAEACLWKYTLKNKQLRGHQFRRQRPVLHYIADFLCKELMLIIEIDGITHDTEKALVKDQHREAALKLAGFEVIRFTDQEILENITGVSDKLLKIVKEIENSSPYPLHKRDNSVKSL
jgi:very-short-patch-repair endonuclease